MSTIVGIIQQIVQEELRQVRVAELAVVKATYPHSSNGDKDNYACDVQLKSTGLVLKKVPVVTQRVGTVAIPNPGDLVLLAFDRGDVNQPLLVGRLYNDQDRPPRSKENEIIFRLPLAEPDNKTVKMEARNLQQQSPPREILLEMLPDLKLCLVDTEVQATVGKTKITLTTRGGGSGGVVTIQAGDSKVTIKQDGDVTVESQAKMTLKARGEMSLEASSIQLKSQGDTTIQAQFGSVAVEGQTGASLKSMASTNVEGTMTTVKGATTQIKGMTSFSPA
jgi:hypothetical protein